MKSFFFLSRVAIVVCAVSTGYGESAARQCGKNEKWEECVSGSCAEKTCKNPVVGPSCTADCKSGCFCTDEFYRNDEGSCVARDQCPPEQRDAEERDTAESSSEELALSFSLGAHESTPASD
ncbi:ixochymostatin-like [Amblyomma americanum]